MTGRSAEDYQAIFGNCTNMMLQLRRLPQPVIARVQGIATAAGCQLVAACDLVVAAEDATFAAPGVKIGLFCTTPMVPLVRAVPPKVAMEMLLTGQPITAERAYEIGLVNRVVPVAGLDAAVDEFVQAILATSPAVIRLGKRLLRATIAGGAGSLRRSNSPDRRKRTVPRRPRRNLCVPRKASSDMDWRVKGSVPNRLVIDDEFVTVQQRPPDVLIVRREIVAARHQLPRGVHIGRGRLG